MSYVDSGHHNLQYDVTMPEACLSNKFRVLQEALREYKGTVIAVSHDRYFLRQIVNRVVEVADNKLRDYSGDYNVCLSYVFFFFDNPLPLV